MRRRYKHRRTVVRRLISRWDFSVTAKIVDLVGINIDAKTKETIGYLCQDYQLTANHAQALHNHADTWENLSEQIAGHESYEDLSEQIAGLIKETMKLVGLRYFETETLLITLVGDDLEIEGRAEKCSPH